MKWLTALMIGGLMGLVLPMSLGGTTGGWLHGWTGWGTVRPHAGSPGLLFSIPVFLGSAVAFRLFFNWHGR